MKIIAWSIFLSLLVLVPPPLISTVPITENLSKRDIEKLIDQYLNEETSERNRGGILTRLLRVAPAATTREIAERIKDDNSRRSALVLATELHTPDLFKEAKKFFDTEEQDLVAKLFFLTQDKGATDFLISKWKQADIESDSFTFLDKGFRTHYVELAPLKDLIKIAKDMEQEKRAASALAILRYQLSWKDKSLEYLTKGWRARVKYLGEFAPRFPLRGIPLTGPETSESKGIEVARNTYRIYKVGEPHAFKVKEHLGDLGSILSYTIDFNVYLESPFNHLARKMAERFYFGAMADEDSSDPKRRLKLMYLAGRNWSIYSSEMIESTRKARLRDWTNISLKVDVDIDTAAKELDIEKGIAKGTEEYMTSTVSFFIDGELLIPDTYELDGVIDRLEVQPQEVEIRVGGAQVLIERVE